MGIEPITVDFPLRGEWVAELTPAERVPSHGTDQLGQRYAYDFVRIDKERRGFKFYRGSVLQYLFLGIKLENCYGWSESIFAPFSGTVVAAEDGWKERKRVHLLRDLAVVLKNAVVFNSKKRDFLRPLVGNYIILKMREQEIYAFFAHARCGSVQVREGEAVHSGQKLAEVGHAGNSTAPHLHFHLMDRFSLLDARGVPCRFREYEALHDGTWRRVTDGMPGKREFIRNVA